VCNSEIVTKTGDKGTCGSGDKILCSYHFHVKSNSSYVLTVYVYPFLFTLWCQRSTVLCGSIWVLELHSAYLRRRAVELRDIAPYRERPLEIEILCSVGQFYCTCL